MVEGIDVSYANPLNINWQQAAASGIKFVYAKATDGVGSLDPKFHAHVRGATSAGLPVGAYHYLRVRAGKPQDAEKQADDFCNAFQAAKCSLLPMLDCEGGGNEKCTPAEWLSAIRTWVAHVKGRLGVDPIIYTYPAFWMGLGRDAATADDLAALKLWIAHYTTAPKPLLPAPWKNWTLWQYAAGVGVIGRVPGVPNVVDRNRLAGELSSIAYAPGIIETPKLPAPAEPMLEQHVPATPTSVPEPVVPSAVPSTGFLSWFVQLLTSFFARR